MCDAVANLCTLWCASLRICSQWCQPGGLANSALHWAGLPAPVTAALKVVYM